MKRDRSIVRLCLFAVPLGAAVAMASLAMTALIGLVTNLGYFHRISLALVSPFQGHFFWWRPVIPVIGGLLAGLMARYGSAAIRGDGIPEVVERVLKGESRISWRVALLKPLSAAIVIGSGGPFGAEGPIIATGGAMGSLLGQALATSNRERRILLGAGAAAGVASFFGTPLAAVFLAIELLLFEFSAAAVFPVCVASGVAMGCRVAVLGPAIPFAMVHVPSSAPSILPLYAAIGALVGLAGVGVSKGLFVLEEWFEHCPVHWMWWPVFGGAAVGLIGVVAPRTLGVGYPNISDAINGRLVWQTLLVLSVWKLASWWIALASGTSGGTLAPLFTIGGGFGAAVAGVLAWLVPASAVDVRIGALVGMATMFGCTNRALLTAVVFAVEATGALQATMPVLIGATVGCLVFELVSNHSIVTQKLAQRGMDVPDLIGLKSLLHVRVGECATTDVVAARAEWSLGELKEWHERLVKGQRHGAYPVVDQDGRPIGFISSDQIWDNSIGPEWASSLAVPLKVDESMMVGDILDRLAEGTHGRIAVVNSDGHLEGILSRSDISAFLAREHLRENERGVALNFL